MAALYQSGDQHETALFIAFPILEVEVDVPNINDVLIYLKNNQPSVCYINSQTSFLQ
jgi:hypothetical protein